MEKSNVFLDTSVLLTAVLSSTGGSFYILNTLGNAFTFYINAYVFEETTRVLTVKLRARQDLANKLFLLIGLTPIRIVPDPSKEQIKTAARIINPKDAPILISALQYASHFITMDNDFLEEGVVRFAEAKGLVILKPKDFIQKFRASA
ncbi:PIN domain-containing protein [Candidatus Azambacteria bacterium]|nr:PIN domain-containing protein [Candidatus Azambacteria bacterium]MBI3685691.1 PIN domain-containing protein [Candidatus Azambacteria bacterium]